ncbi:OLC1v1014999C1 [Oldenlandia corymbosa var. corymbosa]|uniref:OLC1v1014999C1 n=1 Tax=Oldenlandia corymbosa var. corymbosa TaxID=529605 RepID=A0AAV1E4P0_OLDCO|nr:OLC1v1014999C1 [Oldenlandia corymbosa var. corymbosa]
MGNGTEGPKLFVNKPKKGQLKKVEHQQQPSSSMASSAPPPGSAAAAAAPSPRPPKESFLRRYKFVVPLLLAVNLSVGAYLFMRTKKKDVVVDEKEVPNVPSARASTSIPNATVTEKPAPVVALTSAVVTPPKPREPIPENEQRELFKWLLEEKRKLKPIDSAEKKRIDEEKAILKEFIRAKSIPSL